MMRGNFWRFFFEKLLCLPFASECVCWFLDVLFIYSKENCIIWHLFTSISALLDIVSLSVPAVLKYRQCTGIPAFSNKYTHRLTHYWFKGDSLEFIVFITLKWSNFAGSSSSHNIT